MALIVSLLLKGSLLKSKNKRPHKSEMIKETAKLNLVVFY